MLGSSRHLWVIDNSWLFVYSSLWISHSTTAPHLNHRLFHNVFKSHFMMDSSFGPLVLFQIVFVLSEVNQFRTGSISGCVSRHAATWNSANLCTANMACVDGSISSFTTDKMRTWSINWWLVNFSLLYSIWRMLNISVTQLLNLNIFGTSNYLVELVSCHYLILSGFVKLFVSSCFVVSELLRDIWHFWEVFAKWCLKRIAAIHIWWSWFFFLSSSF